MHALLDTPIGRMVLVADGRGLLAAGFDRLPASLGAGRAAGGVAAKRHLDQACRALAGYFEGTRTSFQEFALPPAGTAFQQRVWRALRSIPYGQTSSYGEVARQIGAPSAARAVGLASARNPIGVIVPCHRVIGADGALTGYGGGLDRKEWLLRHEGGLPYAQTWTDT